MYRLNRDETMASRKRSQYWRGMTFIGELIFQRGQEGDLDVAVRCRRTGDAVTITVYHPEGVATFTYTDEEVERDMTLGQREVRRLRREGRI
jgi:hypothetical protein